MYVARNQSYKYREKKHIFVISRKISAQTTQPEEKKKKKDSYHTPPKDGSQTTVLKEK